MRGPRFGRERISRKLSAAGYAPDGTHKQTLAVRGRRRHADIPGDKGVGPVAVPKLSTVLGTVNAIALVLVLGAVAAAAMVLVVKLSRSR
jgi:hypothetical protein